MKYFLPNIPATGLHLRLLAGRNIHKAPATLSSRDLRPIHRWHRDDPIPQDCAEEHRVHAPGEINIEQHEAEVAFADQVRMRLRGFVLYQFEIGCKLAGAERGAVE